VNVKLPFFSATLGGFRNDGLFGLEASVLTVSLKSSLPLPPF